MLPLARLVRYYITVQGSDKMPALTDRQTEFVHHLVTIGCTPTEAARAAGYAEPKQEAYRLTRLPHVQTAVREERERLVTCDLANVALRTIREIMEDKQASSSARVSAARTAFEVAGMFERKGGDIGSSKPLHDMTAEELEIAIRRLDDQLAASARGSSVN